MKKRQSKTARKTGETDIACKLVLDGSGKAKIKTGVGFYDHMLHALTRHSGIDLDLTCKGDIEVDDHHSVEDCAIVLGEAFDEALGEGKGIARFGWAFAPMDEALARAAVDISGRPYGVINLGLAREKIGDLSCENIGHALHSFAMSARITLHVEVLYGESDHHKAEAAFKAVALALKQAIARTGSDEAPSTKGTLK